MKSHFITIFQSECSLWHYSLNETWEIRDDIVTAGVNKIMQGSNLLWSGSSLGIHSAKRNATSFIGQQERLPVNDILEKDTLNSTHLLHWLLTALTRQNHGGKNSSCEMYWRCRKDSQRDGGRPGWQLLLLTKRKGNVNPDLTHRL